MKKYARLVDSCGTREEILLPDTAVFSEGDTVEYLSLRYAVTTIRHNLDTMTTCFICVLK